MAPAKTADQVTPDAVASVELPAAPAIAIGSTLESSFMGAPYCGAAALQRTATRARLRAE